MDGRRRPYGRAMRNAGSDRGYTPVSASTRRIRRNTVPQPRSQTCVGELVCVAIARTDLEPLIVNGLVQSSLEIGIPHIDEMVPSQYAASSNLTFDENAEYLASYFFIRCHSVGLPREPDNHIG